MANVNDPQQMKRFLEVMRTQNTFSSGRRYDRSSSASSTGVSVIQSQDMPVSTVDSIPQHMSMGTSLEPDAGDAAEGQNSLSPGSTGDSWAIVERPEIQRDDSRQASNGTYESDADSAIGTTLVATPPLAEEGKMQSTMSGIFAPEDVLHPINKHLYSPILEGRKAPPSTPVTSAQRTHPENDDVQEILGRHVHEHFAGKSDAVGLAESAHAPRCSPNRAGAPIQQASKKSDNQQAQAQPQKTTHRSPPKRSDDRKGQSQKTTDRSSANPNQMHCEPTGSKPVPLAGPSSFNTKAVASIIRSTKDFGRKTDQKSSPLSLQRSVSEITIACSESSACDQSDNKLPTAAGQLQSSPQIPPRSNPQTAISKVDIDGYVPPHLRVSQGTVTKQAIQQVTEKALPEVSNATPSRKAISNSADDCGPLQVAVETAIHADLGPQETDIFFTRWPKTEKRINASSRVRKVRITGLPDNVHARFVASLVYGGSLENIHIESPTSATVLFLNADDCMSYSKDTANGLVYRKDEFEEHVAFVDLAKDVDVIGGQLQQMIDEGVTRCVKAIGVDPSLTMDDLKAMPAKKGFRVEHIEDFKNPRGYRVVIFRFCEIRNAFAFKGLLLRDEEWEHCNVRFADDPCKAAMAIHFER